MISRTASRAESEHTPKAVRNRSQLGAAGNTALSWTQDNLPCWSSAPLRVAPDSHHATMRLTRFGAHLPQNPRA
jgi:hypothetical protein